MALSYKDLEGLVKNSIHIDEFSSKMGDDDDIVTVSFYVRDRQASEDLMHWLEKGYDFILDAEASPGELKPNRYLVYMELRRRSSVVRHIQTVLDDLNTLTEFEPEDWTMMYKGEEYPYSESAVEQYIPLSPQAYREQNDGELNEMRVASGIAPKRIYSDQAADIQAMKHAAGI